MKRKFLLLSLILFMLPAANFIKAQEIPDENENNNTPVIDSIETNEDLLDSNEAYKKQFDSLSNEGEWQKVTKSDFLRDLSAETGEDFNIDYSQSGEVIYVWRPFCADQYWNPYSNGNWVFSYYGWVWVSSYNWGWGPYNYGRWYCSNYYGWVWLPGGIWAANWVTWRCNNNYVGWYPTCPRVRWRNYSNQICTNHLFSYVPTNWVFVKKNNFTKKIDNTTIVSAGSNAGIIKQTKKVSATTYAVQGSPKIKYKGPDVNDISKETGKAISPKEVAVTNSKVKPFANEKNVSTYKNVSNTKVKEQNSRTPKNNAPVKNTTRKETNSGTKSNTGNNNTHSSPSNNGTKKVNTGRNNGGRTKGGNRKSKIVENITPPDESGNTKASDVNNTRTNSNNTNENNNSDNTKSPVDTGNQGMKK